jgi:Dyp-type peroxidase family
LDSRELEPLTLFAARWHSEQVGGFMATEVTSKHLKTSVELTLLADIKPGFPDSIELVSYATRLGILLKMFFELRRVTIEERPSGLSGPLERLRSLHFVRWSILDGRKLLLGVTFDRPWEPYIRGIVDQAGPFLDVILCHCREYEGHSTVDGYLRFAEWVRKYQIEENFFYAAEPDLTVDDLRYLREFERRYRESAASKRLTEFPALAAALHVGKRDEDNVPPLTPPDPKVALVTLEKGLRAFEQVRLFFPATSPDGKAPAPGTADQDFFDKAALQLLRADTKGQKHDRIPDLMLGLPPDLQKLLTEMRGEEPPPRNPPREPPPGRDEEVQGNVLTPYSASSPMTHGCFVLVRFDGTEQARNFLKRLKPEITTAASAEARNERLNVALTFNGLRTLGLREATLARFPKEFREGMEARAGLLGDVGEEHPANWALPTMNWKPTDFSAERIPLSTVDLVLILQKRCAETTGDHLWTDSHPLYESLEALHGGAQGVHFMHVQPLRRYPKGAAVVDRFGFHDGLSQPKPCFPSDPLQTDQVAFGEILLGYENDRGEYYPPGPPSESGHDLFLNGSFMVVRKLEQHVKRLRDFVEEHSKELPGTDSEQKREELYAKLMGRYRDGRSVMSPDLGNDFHYRDDPEGKTCPFAAHVRRANPRTEPEKSVHGLNVTVPRILRRGFSYGPEDSSKDTGLMFMAYNASIAEQFEVVQRWINGGNSTGVLSTHADPIASHRADQVITLTIGDEVVHLKKREPFVTLKWGMYLFQPSISALAALAEPTVAAGDDPSANGGTRAYRPDKGEEDRVFSQWRRPAEDPALVGKGAEIIKALQNLERERPDEAKIQWKVVLEDPAPAAVEKRDAVWAAIRQLGGALETPYGILVGSASAVRDVLGTETDFSVREYWHRMNETVGPLYLGMDRCPAHVDRRPPDPKHSERDEVYERQVRPEEGGKPSTYDAEATTSNAFFYDELTWVKCFEESREIAGAYLAQLVEKQHKFDAEVGVVRRPVVDVKLFAREVVGQLSARWFGHPNHAEGPDATELFFNAAKHIFYPHPEAVVSREVRKKPVTAEARAKALAANPEMAVELRGRDQGVDIGQALVGGAQGFLATTYGSFLKVTDQWLETSKFSRLQQQLKNGPHWDALRSGKPCLQDIEDSQLIPEVLTAMQRQPVPDILHRTAVRAMKQKWRLVDIDAGETVVVSLGSASVDPTGEIDFLFGGRYGGPLHACPGKKAALGTILGMIVALLDRKDLKRERRFALSMAPKEPIQSAAGPRDATLQSGCDPGPQKLGSLDVPNHAHRPESGESLLDYFQRLARVPLALLELAQLKFNSRHFPGRTPRDRGSHGSL